MLTALFSLILTVAASWSTDTATDGLTTCDPYTYSAYEQGVMDGTTDPGMWSDLQDIGWRGDPTDGMEALYAPECGA